MLSTLVLLPHCCLPQMVAMSALLLLRNADHLLGDEPKCECSSGHSALA